MDKSSLGITFGSIARRVGEISLGTPAVITIAAIAVIAWTLASLMPRFWALGELVLLAACILLIREGVAVYAGMPRGRVPKDALAGGKAWSAGAAAWSHGSSVNQQSSLHRPSSLWEFGPARADFRSRKTRVAGTDSDEMLAQVFSRASSKHRSHLAGKPENTRSE